MAPTPTTLTSSPTSTSKPSSSLSHKATVGVGVGVAITISISLILAFLLLQSYLRRRKRRRGAHQQHRTHFQQPFPKFDIETPSSTPASSFESRRSHRRTLSLHEPPPVALPPMAGTGTVAGSSPEDATQQDWATFFQPVEVRHAVSVRKSRSRRVSRLSAIVEASPTAAVPAGLMWKGGVESTS